MFELCNSYLPALCPCVDNEYPLKPFHRTEHSAEPLLGPKGQARKSGPGSPFAKCSEQRKNFKAPQNPAPELTAGCVFCQVITCDTLSAFYATSMFVC